ncbi:MAG: hypothetical protein NVSMB56_11550 [Pyrinomonadaceae bacterium]
MGLSFQIPSDDKSEVLIASREKITEEVPLNIPSELEHLIVIAKLGDLRIIGIFGSCDKYSKSGKVYKCVDYLDKLENNFRSQKVIATGDFNLGKRGSDVGKSGKAKGEYENYLQPILDKPDAKGNCWVDVWKRDHMDEREWSYRTWGKWSADKPNKQVSRPDHLFATSSLASLITKPTYSFDELDANLSDHAPLTAELDNSAINFPDTHN